MVDIEMKHGHNNFEIKSGQGYNITFDADTKRVLREKDAEIERLQDVLIKMNVKVLALRAKHNDWEIFDE